MNILNMIPIVGWVLAAILCTLVAIPVNFLWNLYVPEYFSFLPSVWHHIPFWDSVGLIWLVISIKGIILPQNIASLSDLRGDK